MDIENKFYKINTYNKRYIDWSINPITLEVKNNKGQIMQPIINNSGYYCFNYFGLLHRLLALTFIPNPENKPCVDHIDGDKTNNMLSNLRWVTYSENMMNPITRKRNSDAQKLCQLGDKNGMYGKHHTAEAKHKQRERKLGENNPMFGTHPVFTEEHRKNISLSKKGKKLFLCEDGKKHFI